MILTKKYDYTLVRGKENERERERDRCTPIHRQHMQYWVAERHIVDIEHTYTYAYFARSNHRQTDGK